MSCVTEIWVRREGGVKMCARTRAGAADTTQAVRCDRCRRAGVWSPRYERLEKEIYCREREGEGEYARRARRSTRHTERHEHRASAPRSRRALTSALLHAACQARSAKPQAFGENGTRGRRAGLRQCTATGAQTRNHSNHTRSPMMLVAGVQRTCLEKNGVGSSTRGSRWLVAS